MTTTTNQEYRMPLIKCMLSVGKCQIQIVSLVYTNHRVEMRDYYQTSQSLQDSPRRSLNLYYQVADVGPCIGQHAI